MGKTQKSIGSLSAKNLKDLHPEFSESPLGNALSMPPGTLSEMLKSPQTYNSTLARLIERIKNL